MLLYGYKGAPVITCRYCQALIFVTVFGGFLMGWSVLEWGFWSHVVLFFFVELEILAEPCVYTILAFCKNRLEICQCFHHSRDGQNCVIISNAPNTVQNQNSCTLKSSYKFCWFVKPGTKTGTSKFRKWNYWYIQRVLYFQHLLIWMIKYSLLQSTELNNFAKKSKT